MSSAFGKPGAIARAVCTTAVSRTSYLGRQGESRAFATRDTLLEAWSVKNRNRRQGRSACALLMERQMQRSRGDAALARGRCSPDRTQVPIVMKLHVALILDGGQATSSAYSYATACL